METNVDEERTKLLVQMFEGHYFGELALIYGEPRNASVRATEEASAFTATKRGGFVPDISAELCRSGVEPQLLCVLRGSRY